MTGPNNFHKPGDLQATFAIFPNTPTMFTFLADPSGCDSPYTFFWEFGDGSSYIGSQLWAQHTYAEEGRYTVSLTATATIYSGDSVSVSAPSQFVDVKKAQLKEIPFITQKPVSPKESTDIRMANVSSKQLTTTNNKKNINENIFEGLNLDVEKLNLRIATVIGTDPIPESDKFFKLHVSTGSKKRTVVAKVREDLKLNPNSYIGRKVILVTNLAPISLCNIKSQGLLLKDLGIWEANKNHGKNA
ncbi:MAG: PKD domain-containing protein [Rhabdochlamydiaceae bacterium]|nr:PKD domain-containing protein [Rhabdochlamydiaceae bacterium]